VNCIQYYLEFHLLLLETNMDDYNISLIQQQYFEDLPNNIGI